MKIIRHIITSVYMVSAMAVAPAMAEGQPPEPGSWLNPHKIDKQQAELDICYMMAGVAMFERKAIRSIEEDGDSYKVKLNTQEWNFLPEDTRDLLGECIKLFNNYPGEDYHGSEIENYYGE